MRLSPRTVLKILICIYLVIFIPFFGMWVMDKHHGLSPEARAIKIAHEEQYNKYQQHDYKYKTYQKNLGIR